METVFNGKKIIPLQQIPYNASLKNVRGKNRVRSSLSLEGNNVNRIVDVDVFNGNVHTRKRRRMGLSEERLCISE